MIGKAWTIVIGKKSPRTPRKKKPHRVRIQFEGRTFRRQEESSRGLKIHAADTA